MTEVIRTDNTDVIANACKKIAYLEAENAELKKKYEDSLIACGVLKNKVDLLAQPSPIESMQDALITTQEVVIKKQKEQLTKAKEIIKKFSEFVNNEIEYDPEHPQEHTDLWNKLCEEAEQFINEVDK